jgi:hypothetical protein
LATPAHPTSGSRGIDLTEILFLRGRGGGKMGELRDLSRLGWYLELLAFVLVGLGRFCWEPTCT